MLHYVKFLQVIPNKNFKTSPLFVVNGRTSGLTRTHTSYVCSPECLWDEVMNARWESVNNG